MATLTVRGHGVADVEPSRVEVGLVLSATAPTAGEAYADVTARAAALADVLDELKVPATDRVTESLTLSQDHGYEGPEQPAAPVYRAWRRTRVRLRDVDAFGQLVGRAVDGAGAGIDGVQWHVDLDDPGRLEACRRAAESARERARAYADALGIPLGKVVAAVEAGAAAPAGTVRAFAAISHQAFPVDAGAAQVAAAIDVTYVLGEDADA